MTRRRSTVSTKQKSGFSLFVQRFLGSMTEEQFAKAVKAIKSLPEKAGELLRRFSGPLSGVVTAVLMAFGLPALNIRAAEALAEDQTKLCGWTLSASSISRAIGFESIYVLVDRVDEISLTATDASKTLRFIQSLATDLPTLELPGMGFKFFLWDLIEDDLCEPRGSTGPGSRSSRWRGRRKICRR